MLGTFIGVVALIALVTFVCIKVSKTFNSFFILGFSVLFLIISVCILVSSIGSMKHEKNDEKISLLHYYDEQSYFEL